MATNNGNGNGNVTPAASLWTMQCQGYRQNTGRQPHEPLFKLCERDAAWEMVIQQPDDPHSAKVCRYCPACAGERRRAANRGDIIIWSEKRIEAVYG